MDIDMNKLPLQTNGFYDYITLAVISVLTYMLMHMYTKIIFVGLLLSFPIITMIFEQNQANYFSQIPKTISIIMFDKQTWHVLFIQYKGQQITLNKAGNQTQYTTQY